MHWSIEGNILYSIWYMHSCCNCGLVANAWGLVAVLLILITFLEIRIRLFTLMRIRIWIGILLLIKVMRFLSLHASIWVSTTSVFWLWCGSGFWLWYTDPDTAFHSDYPASKNDADSASGFYDFFRVQSLEHLMSNKNKKFSFRSAFWHWNRVQMYILWRDLTKVSSQSITRGPMTNMSGQELNPDLRDRRRAI
jgi:hypothetical protein